jgi:hypothetical protein
MYSQLNMKSLWNFALFITSQEWTIVRTSLWGLDHVLKFMVGMLYWESNERNNIREQDSIFHEHVTNHFFMETYPGYY